MDDEERLSLATTMEDDIEDKSVEEKKHVTIEDVPEVFNIVPDSLEVERQEGPKTLDILELEQEHLDPDQVEVLIQEIENIIHVCEEKVLNKKLNNAKLGCLLIRIAESIEEYENYMSRLFRFLVNGDDVTGKYFIDLCERLPCFGNYLPALSENAVDTTLMIEEIEGPVQKTDLQMIVKDIVENTYNSGKFLGSFRTMNKSINKCMRVRTQVTEQFSRQIKSWLKLSNAESEHLDALRDRLSKLSAYLNFIKSGDTRIKNANDSSGSDFESCIRTIFHSSMLGECTSKSGISVFTSSLEDNKTSCVEPFVFGDNTVTPESSCFTPDFNPHDFC